jgi:hypothetical protein
MTEAWTIISGFPDYAVSNAGRVKRVTPARRTYAGRILKPLPAARYLYVGLIRPDGALKRLRIHRLVAQAFIPNPNGFPEVNHKNPHARHDNRAGNLEWTTRQGNCDHAGLHKLLNKPRLNVKQKHVTATPNNTWQARIQRHHLGTYKTKAAALHAVEQYLGEYKWKNK